MDATSHPNGMICGKPARHAHPTRDQRPCPGSSANSNDFVEIENSSDSEVDVNDSDYDGWSVTQHPDGGLDMQPDTSTAGRHSAATISVGDIITIPRLIPYLEHDKASNHARLSRHHQLSSPGFGDFSTGLYPAVVAAVFTTHVIALPVLPRRMLRAQKQEYHLAFGAMSLTLSTRRDNANPTLVLKHGPDDGSKEEIKFWYPTRGAHVNFTHAVTVDYSWPLRIDNSLDDLSVKMLQRRYTFVHGKLSQINHRRQDVEVEKWLKTERLWYIGQTDEGAPTKLPHFAADMGYGTENSDNNKRSAMIEPARCGGDKPLDAPKKTYRVMIAGKMMWACPHLHPNCIRNKFSNFTATDICKHDCCQRGSKSKPKQCEDIRLGMYMDYDEKEVNGDPTLKVLGEMASTVPSRKSAATSKDVGGSMANGDAQRQARGDAENTTDTARRASEKRLARVRTRSVAAFEEADVIGKSESSGDDERPAKRQKTSRKNSHDQKDACKKKLKTTAQNPANTWTDETDDGQSMSPPAAEDGIATDHNGDNNNSITQSDGRTRQQSRSNINSASQVAGIPNSTQCTVGSMRNNSAVSNAGRLTRSGSGASATATGTSSRHDLPDVVDRHRTAESQQRAPSIMTQIDNLLKLVETKKANAEAQVVSEPGKVEGGEEEMDAWTLRAQAIGIEDPIDVEDVPYQIQKASIVSEQADTAMDLSLLGERVGESSEDEVDDTTDYSLDKGDQEDPVIW